MRMDWLGQRQSVIASNIANADTPEFIARDMKPGAFRRALASAASPVHPTTSHAAHISSRPGRDASEVAEQRERYETAPSGNGVVLEEQMIKSAKNQADHDAMALLYKKHMTLYRLALRGSGGG